MIELASKGIAATSSDSQNKGAAGSASHAVAAEDQQAGQQQTQGVEQDPSTSMQSLPISVSVTR